MIFEVANVKCENCAKLIKNALQEDFGEIELDLSKEPRQISVSLNESQIKPFCEALGELGFDILRQI